MLSIETVNPADFSSFYGPAEVVLSAAFYALFSVLSKPMVQKYGAPPVTIWSALLGTAMMLPLVSQGFAAQIASLSEVGWASVLYLSVLSTVLGYLIYFTLVSRTAVSRLSIQLFLGPLVSVVGGALLLAEPISLATLLGGGMMLVAVALVTGVVRR